MLREAYEVTYQIFDHLAQHQKNKQLDDPALKRPLASVALHPAEDLSGVLKLYERLRRFADCEVANYYGISLTEFLSYPRDVCDFILKDCEYRLKVKLRTNEQELARFRNELDHGQK